MYFFTPEKKHVSLRGIQINIAQRIFLHTCKNRFLPLSSKQKKTLEYLLNKV